MVGHKVVGRLDKGAGVNNGEMDFLRFVAPRLLARLCVRVWECSQQASQRIVKHLK